MFGFKKKTLSAENYWRSRGAHIGDGSRLAGTIMDPSYPFLISVGNNTVLSACRILTHDASTMQVLGYSKCGKVIIGDNCFIGADAVILPGTKIGDNVIIGAGAIVHGLIPENGVYIGSSFQGLTRLSSYDDFVSKQKEAFRNRPVFNMHWSDMSDADKSRVLAELSEGETGFIR